MKNQKPHTNQAQGRPKVPEELKRQKINVYLKPSTLLLLEEVSRQNNRKLSQQIAYELEKLYPTTEAEITDV